jgi:biopolymer transport protein ExbD
MRTPTRAMPLSLAFSMTPMIDVVFLLIIFFLLSSHLSRQETQLALPLPAAQSARHEIGNDRPRLTVNVLADGTLLVANRAVLEIRIRSDRSVPYSRVEPILLACTRAGIGDVAFAVTPPRPPLTTGK